MKSLRPHRRASRRLSAFTLVELLVAFALSLIIMGVTAEAFRQGTFLFRVGYAKVQAAHSAWSALDHIERDLWEIDTSENYFKGYSSLAAGAGMDNDADGSNDEDGNARNVDDPVDVLNTAGRERHAFEFLNVADDPHIAYYVTRDKVTEENAYEVGRLIRFAFSEGTLESAFGRDMDSGGSNPPSPDFIEDHCEVAYGITQFRVHYYRQGEWYDEWDSVVAGALPEAIYIRMRIVDERMVLDEDDDRSPLVMARLFRVGEP